MLTIAQQAEEYLASMRPDMLAHELNIHRDIAAYIKQQVEVAPELLAALKLAKDRITRLEGTWKNAGLLTKYIDEAIAHAEGQP